MNTTSNAGMKTLSECVTYLKDKGYDKDFQVTEHGMKTTDDDKLYQPEEVAIENFYRFEGASDPGDMSILYAIKTDDDVKGTLTDAYGPYASGKVSEFIGHVEAIQKKKEPAKPWWKFWN